MKLQLLPSTFESDGSASRRQHLTTLVINDSVAFDAGSLAMACSEEQRKSIRDVVVSHAHLDHIAGLPLFIDDLFSTLTESIRIHAARSVIDLLEKHIFNWSIYPRFSELRNDNGPVMEYVEFEANLEKEIGGLSVIPIEVNHRVPSCGFVISEGRTTIAVTGDTAPTEDFWFRINRIEQLDAVLIECAFPDGLGDLAEISHHLTPSSLAGEIKKLERNDCPIFVVNIKPAYRQETIDQIGKLGIPNLQILEAGRDYRW